MAHRDSAFLLGHIQDRHSVTEDLREHEQVMQGFEQTANSANLSGNTGSEWNGVLSGRNYAGICDVSNKFDSSA